MTMVVAHNNAAINTQKNLYNTNRAMSSSLEKLSSGYRINTGKDAPADLIISELLRSQIGGLQRATRNSSEAMNVFGIAEGALNEMNEILKKMKQLAIHAANNGITSTEQIRADQAEIDSGIQTIDRIANTTRYSNQFLLNGGKGLVFDRTTSRGNSLLDMRFSRIDMVFKNKGTQVNVQYSAYDEVNRAAIMTAQARRAYTEGVGDLRNQNIAVSDHGTGGVSFSGENGYYNRIRANERVYESGDVYNSIYDYRFDGISTGANTDENGNLYFEINSNGTKLNVYADKNKTRLVAEGSIVADSARDTFVYLNSVSGSGLRGYVRVDPSKLSQSANRTVTLQVTDGDLDSTSGTLMKDQRFIVTGNGGSIQFDFAKGQDIGTVAAAINNVSASTGVGAAIILADGAISNLDSEGRNTDEAKNYYLINEDVKYNELTAAADLTKGANNTSTNSATSALVNSADALAGITVINSNAALAIAKELGISDAGIYNIKFEWRVDAKPAGNTLTNVSLYAVGTNGRELYLGKQIMEYTDPAAAPTIDTAFAADPSLPASITGGLTAAFAVTNFSTHSSTEAIDAATASCYIPITVTATATSLSNGTWLGTSVGAVKMEGVDYLKNTDADGRIYIRYEGQETDSAGNTYDNFVAYRAIKADGSFDNSDIVARTKIATADYAANDKITLIEDNASGLNITFTVAAKPAAADKGTISVVRQGAFDEWDFSDVNGRETLVRGFNTDSAGKLYTSITSVDSVTNKAILSIYKDSARTQAVATGTINLVAGAANTYTIQAGRIAFTQIDGSGLNGSVQVGPAVINTSGVAPGANQYIQVGYGFDILTERVKDFNMDGASNVRHVTLDGLSIGLKEDSTRNTDVDGRLYIKTEQVGNTFKMTFYRDNTMKEAVATTDFFEKGTHQVKVRELNSSGLSGTVDYSANMTAGVTEIRCEVGIRMFSTNYGSDQYIRVQNMEGNLWSYYDNDYSEFTEIEQGVTKQFNGQNATLTVNGLEVYTKGLTATVTSQVLSADLVLMEGIISKFWGQGGTNKPYGTTVAQLGYNVGNAMTRAGQLENASNLFINAAMTNVDQMSNFQNGMQLQLGEGAGDQERTVLSIQSMAVANLGKVEFSDDFDPTTPGLETQILTLQDVAGSGKASLAIDPVKALAIIEQAIKDVSELRARIGAVQANLLQTNINNLNVSVENMIKTESNIRDTDMAVESTEFTKNQIMVNAGTTMLAQANVLAQNVLKLLGG